MSATTCPACRQLVAVDAAGIRPHVRRGSPCPGGRPAPKPVQAHEVATRARLTPELRADVAERQREARERVKAKALRRSAARRAEARALREARGTSTLTLANARAVRIRAMLPTTAQRVAAALAITVEGAVKAMLRAGAVRVGTEPVEGGGRPRTVYGLPAALAEASP